MQHAFPEGSHEYKVASALYRKDDTYMIDYLQRLGEKSAIGQIRYISTLRSIAMDQNLLNEKFQQTALSIISSQYEKIIDFGEKAFPLSPKQIEIIVKYLKY
jgi:hypothetical protein